MKKLTIWLILCLLLLIGLYFRWQYATTISLFIDEFTTMWAAQRILESGVPIMPSGVLYTRGLLSSYVEALFLAFHFSPLVARLPSILLGLLAILATYMVGRDHFDWRVGLLAAALMTLAPEQIVWSGRARFYIQLQLFVLLAAWAAFESIREEKKDKGWRLHTLFALLFILALFSQEETILLYPGIVLAIVAWQGWRFFLKPAVFVTHLVCVIAMVVRYAIEKLGQPGYFETIQDQRPYLRLALDIGGALEEYADFFIAPSRIPLTLFVLGAIAVAFYQLFRRKGSMTISPAKDVPEGEGTIWHLFTYGSPQLRALSLRVQATFFYLLLFLVVFSIIVIFVGQTWREMRYLFLLVPFWFLIAAEGALCLIERLSHIVLRGVPSRNSRAQAGATVVLTVGALLLFLPDAQEALTLQVEGYDLALEYIAEQRKVGDAVLTPQPPSCALILGPCDYYAIQKGYEEYVIQREGQLIDRWSGAPLLDTVDELREVIASHPNTYFMVDGYRLATRYEPDFIRTIVEQMDVVFTERGISVLRAQGLRALPDLPIKEAFEPPINFGNQIGLSAAELSTTSLAANQTIEMMLTWTGIGAVWGEYNIFLHLVAPDNRIIAQDDGPPVKNLLPTWLFGATPHPDPRQLRIPLETEAGRYRIRVGLYDLKSQERLPRVEGDVVGDDDGWTLDYIRVGAAPELPLVPVHIDFEPGIQLVSHSSLSEPVSAGQPLNLSLAWQAKQTLPHNYTVFIHLIAPDGTLIAQDDRPPEGGFYPTSAWDISEVVVDHYTLTLPSDAGEGQYRISAGLYRPETDERLQRSDGGGDAVKLGTIEVGQ